MRTSRLETGPMRLLAYEEAGRLLFAGRNVVPSVHPTVIKRYILLS